MLIESLSLLIQAVGMIDLIGKKVILTLVIM